MGWFWEAFRNFSQINRATFWGNLPHADGVDYYRVLREAAGRAEGAISGVYDDLQRRTDALIAIPESYRKKLAKQVQAFYDGNGMGGGFWQKRCAATNGRRKGLSNALLFGRTPYVRVDPPHNGQGYHINMTANFWVKTKSMTGYIKSWSIIHQQKTPIIFSKIWTTHWQNGSLILRMRGI